MVIGLTGAAGAGKDTVADILVAEHGFTKISFGASIYREVSEAFGVDLLKMCKKAGAKEAPDKRLALTRCSDNAFSKALILGLVKKGHTEDLAGFLSYRRSPREILQWWGTEYRRSQNKTYWISQVESQLSGLTGNVVITDIRDQMELDLLHNKQGRSWIVRRDCAEQEQRSNEHATSVFWRGVAGTELVNNGTKRELAEQIRLALN